MGGAVFADTRAYKPPVQDRELVEVVENIRRQLEDQLAHHSLVASTIRDLRSVCQTHQTGANQDGGDHLPRTAVKSFEAVKKIHHFRTAPNVMPRSRCFRSKMVKTMTGTRKIVAPAATAGQS